MTLTLRLRPWTLCLLLATLTSIASAGPSPTLASARTVSSPTRGAPSYSSLPSRVRSHPSSHPHALRPHVLSGYAYQRQVTVAGGSATVGGSTTTPVPTNSTDYVVQLHLTGSQAAAIYNNAVYNATNTFNGTPFADVTLWYTGGGSPQQIDIDYDSATNGAWSSTNITLWFKLQAPLVASPATDTHYLLASGNATPTVMRNWANIYPLSDDFPGSSLDSSKWHLIPDGGQNPGVTVAGSVMTLTNSALGPSMVSNATFGTGYLVSMYGTMPTSSSSDGVLFMFRNNGPNPPEAGIAGTATYWDIIEGSWGSGCCLGGPPSVANDGTHSHIYSFARDPQGNLYGWSQGQSLFWGNNQVTSALNVEFEIDSYDGASMTETADWVKVRPWITTEPTAFVAASGVIPWRSHHTTRFNDHLSASVDLADGHLDLSSSDLHVSGRGPSLTMNHVWDSTLAQAGITTTAGQGWITDALASMGGVLTGTVVFTDNTGAAYPFVYSGLVTATAPYTTYATPPGLPWQLSTSNLTTSTVGYTMVDIWTGDTLTFDQAGRYLSSQDAYGNANTVVYTSTAAMPITETNSGGRALSFFYGSNGLLSAVQSPLDRATSNAQGQLVAYGYNGSGQLTAQAWGYGTGDQLLASYGYSGTQLVTVTTPYTIATPPYYTHVWTIGYDAAGRVASLTSPISGTAGQTGYTPAYTTTFSYNPGQTVVVEGAGTSAALTTTYTLDAAGEPITITDGLSETTGYRYDADHDVLSSTDANGNTTTNYYQYVGPNGSTGLVTETVQPPITPYSPINVASSPVITHSYDAQTNDLLSTYTAYGDITLYTYDGHHGLLTTSALTGYSPCTNAARRLGRVVPFGLCHRNYLWRGTITTYDPYGERLTTIDGRGVDETSDSTGIATPGQCPGATCASGYTHSYTYTAQGDLLKSWTPPIQTTLNGITTTAPVTTTYGYDGDGNTVAITSANGFATTSGYDHLARLITTTLPAVPSCTGLTITPTATSGYDGDGNVVRHVDGNGDVTTSSYDPLGRLVATTNPVQGTTLYTYTATEQVATQDPQSDVSTYQYDAAGRVTLSTDALGNTTQQQYDRAGNTVALTTGTPLAPTQVETRQYDALDRVVTDTVSGPGAAPLTTVSGYDLDGNAAQVEQPNGDATFNTYDLVHQLIDVEVDSGPVLTPTSALVETSSYDNAGNVTGILDFYGHVHQTSYDGDSRAITDTDSFNFTTTMTATAGFDPDGNALSQIMTATLGQTTQTHSYSSTLNAADWTTSSGDTATGGPALTTVYGYDGAGQPRTQSAITTTLPVTAIVNAAGLVTATVESIGGAGPYTSTVGYNRNDLPITVTMPGGPGIVEGLGYDLDSRPLTLSLSGPATATAPLSSSYSYGYNAASWTTALTSTLNGVTTTQALTHDAQGKLSGLSGAGFSQSWQYDGNGNVLTASITTTAASTTSYGCSASP